MKKNCGFRNVRTLRKSSTQTNIIMSLTGNAGKYHSEEMNNSLRACEKPIDSILDIVRDIHEIPQML